MKNIFRFLMAAVIFFGAVSCAKEDISTSLAGGEVEVTLSVDVPELGTRAFGDGMTVDQLFIAVYEKIGNTTSTIALPISHIDGEGFQGSEAFSGGRATVTMVLLKDKTYDLVFWAQKSGTGAYDVNLADGRNIEANYGADCNLENRDAFFFIRNDWTAGAQDAETEFHLKRPFAQINVANSDADVAFVTANGATIQNSKMTVKTTDICKQLDLVDGSVKNAINAETIFAANAIPTEEFHIDGYNYLAMNYLLVNEKDLVDLEFVFTDDKGVDYTREYTNVPVQRNYRTNILGQIISSPIDFTVVIDPIFETENHMVYNVESLQSLLDTATGNITIQLGSDIKGDVMVHQKANQNITIYGRNYKYDGTIKIHNGSNYNNGTLTIKKVNFETATEGLNFVMPNEFGAENGVTRRYSNNVTVSDCTFTATGAAVNTVVGVQAKSCYNLVVENCTATGVHSLLQAQSCGTNVEVHDCVVNGKNGVAFKQVKAAVVEGTTINAAAYGIRFDGNTDNYGIVVENNNVTAVQPLIVRKMTGKNNTIALAGENTLKASVAGYQVVITNGSDDEAYSVPTGTYTLTGADTYFVYPTANEAAINLLAAIADNTQSQITLTETVAAPGAAFEINRDVVLNMANQVVNAGSTANSKNYALELYGDINVVVNDANFNRAGITADQGANLVFNSGVINHKPERSSRYMFCAWGNGTVITINGGTFNNDRPNNSYFWVDGDAVIYVNGGTFNGVASKNNIITTNGGKVVILGGTFNFDPTNWVAAGHIVTKTGNNWVVSADANTAHAATTAEVKAALAEGKNIYLTNDIAVAQSETESNGYGACGISQKNGGVIDGNGNAVSVNAWTTWDSAINTTGGTIKNLKVTGGMRGIFVNHGGAYNGKVVLENVIIDGTIYTISCDQGTNNGLEATNCTFNGWTSYAATIGAVKFNGCSFGSGQGYAFCRPYAATEFVNCAFAAGYEIDARAAVTFENCTLGGVALTADNLATLVTGNTANATVK